MQAVGQLDDHHPDVLAHGEQQLPVGFGHLFLVGLVVDLGDLGVAVDDHGNRRPEQLLDVIQGGAGILHQIVHVTGTHRFRVHL